MSVKMVRSLRRGLDVLTMLERNRQGVTLVELNRALDLPKPTLLRILATLVESGRAWRRLADGAYLASGTHGGADPEIGGRIAELASPVMARLSRDLLWPSVIAVPARDHMAVVETNSPLSAYDNARLGPVGARLSYIHTSTGRAYLSACDGTEREAILSRLRTPGLSARVETAFLAVLDEAAERGFAMREPLIDWPGFMSAEVRRDGKRSVGVPIRVGGTVAAAMNVTWPAGRLTGEAFLANHLDRLCEAAGEIGAMLGKEALAA